MSIRSASASASHLVRVTPDLFRVGFASLIAYRAEMVIWILTASMPLVMLALWNAVAADGPVAGFGQAEIARYFVATLIVRQLTGNWVLWQLNFEIRTGALSPKLLRPMHPLIFQGVNSLTAMPIRIGVLLPMLGLLMAWRPDLWHPLPLRILPLFLLSAALAWWMSFLVQACFGTLAFWMDQSLGLYGIWFSVWMLFSGYVAPLAMFPSGATSLLRWAPFRSMFAVPVEILGGFLPPEAILADIGIQLLWTGAFLLLTRFLWRRGVRHYGAHGA